MVVVVGDLRDGQLVPYADWLALVWGWDEETSAAVVRDRPAWADRRMFIMRLWPGIVGVGWGSIHSSNSNPHAPVMVAVHAIVRRASMVPDYIEMARAELVRGCGM